MDNLQADGITSLPIASNPDILSGETAESREAWVCYRAIAG